MSANKRTITCRECARAGGYSDQGDYVFCYRKRQSVPAGERCADGKPVKVSSGRHYRKGTAGHGQ